jgi:methyltransferase family protein
VGRHARERSGCLPPVLSLVLLAPATLPDRFASWNAAQGAPYGRAPGRLTRRFAPESDRAVRERGPFAWQTNNSTRTFEYPWAYHAVAERPTSAVVVELGGGVAGLQYVLAAEGRRVLNVDPGLEATGVGFELERALHDRVGRALAAPVELVSATLGTAGLPDESVDVVLAVSSLEHFSEDDLAELTVHVPRVLKRSGALVCTVDLFLDTAPFCTAPTNEYGRNIDVAAFLRASGLELEQGEPSELLGFPDFDPDRIQTRLSRYLIGHYPAMAQCLVARRA